MFYFVRIDFFRRKKNNMKMMVVHMVLNQSVVLLFCWFLWGQIDSKLKLGVFWGGVDLLETAKVSQASVEIPPTIKEKRIKAWFESWRLTPPLGWIKENWIIFVFGW